MKGNSLASYIVDEQLSPWLLVDSHSLHPHTHPYHHQAPPKKVVAAKGLSATRSRAPNGAQRNQHSAGYRSRICLNNVEIRT